MFLLYLDCDLFWDRELFYLLFYVNGFVNVFVEKRYTNIGISTFWWGAAPQHHMHVHLKLGLHTHTESHEHSKTVGVDPASASPKLHHLIEFPSPHLQELFGSIKADIRESY